MNSRGLGLIVACLHWKLQFTVEQWRPASNSGDIGCWESSGVWNKLCPRICIPQYHKYSAVFAVLVSGEESVWVGRRSHSGRALLSYQATGFKNSPALRFCSATLTHRVRLRMETCRVWRGCWAASPSCCRMTHSLISLGATSFSPDMRFRGFFRGAALTLYKYRCVMIGCG